LLLGGHTATLSAGRITQYGPTAETYRRPETLETARVFSDPPVNIATIEKRGNQAYLSDSVSWQAPGNLAAMPDGNYCLALRPHHLLPQGEGVEVAGEVQIAEISGSESTVRINVEGNNWVSETHGIHNYEFGQTVSFFFDPNRCLYFDSEERLIET